MPHLIGYARVSTRVQRLDLQTDELTRAGYTRIRGDAASGATAGRPRLDAARLLLSSESAPSVAAMTRSLGDNRPTPIRHLGATA